MFRKRFLTLVSSLALVAGAFTAPALAQTQAAPLPPALQAAINSGDASRITQAINVLSGGNFAQRATLAQQVAARAEQLLAVNPRAAVAAAQAAVNVFAGNLALQNSNPGAANAVAATAARIAVSPSAQAVLGGFPGGAAGLAGSASGILSNSAVVAANPTAAGQAQAQLASVGNSGTPRGNAIGGEGAGAGSNAGNTRSATNNNNSGASLGAVSTFETGQGSGNGSPDGR